MIVLDASVALKWFATGEPLLAEAAAVLDGIERSPQEFLVPEIFMNECLAVLCRMEDATVPRVQEAMTLIESLGLTRIGNGHELLEAAARFSIEWKLSGYDATYLALAALSGGVWLTADARAARRIRTPKLVRLLGS